MRWIQKGLTAVCLHSLTNFSSKSSCRFGIEDHLLLQDEASARIHYVVRYNMGKHQRLKGGVMLRFHDSETKLKSRKIRRGIWLCYKTSRVQMFTFFVLHRPRHTLDTLRPSGLTALPIWGTPLQEMVFVTPGGKCRLHRRRHQPATPECTLRAAIGESNAMPGKDVIKLPAGTYVLTLGARFAIRKRFISER